MQNGVTDAFEAFFKKHSTAGRPKIVKRKICIKFQVKLKFATAERSAAKSHAQWRARCLDGVL